MLLSRSRLARGAVGVFWSSALTLIPGAVQGQFTPPAPAVGAQQPPPVVFEISSRVTGTDNGAYAARGQERGDLILSVRPQVRLSRRSAALEFELDAAATLLGYANGTGQGGVLPDVRASLKSMLVDRWVYLDAQARVRQSQADPFGAFAEEGSNVNGRTEGSYRFSPYIEREFLPNTTFLARHDVGLTTNAAGDSTRLLTNRTLARIERRPVPLGAAVELSHLTSEASGDSDRRFTLDTGRVRASLAVSESIVLGFVAGRDRSQFLLSDYTDTLYGASVSWRPGPRTELSIEAERRFFGASGAFLFRHRMPSMSFSLSASRQPVLASASLGVLGQGTDVRNFLDAILTTRYPDAATRSGVVDNLVTSRGLDTRTAQAVDIVADYPQLLTTVQATWAWLSARNAASVVLYSQTTRQLTRDGDPLAASIVSVTDSRQTGASAQFSRRLTPQSSATVLGRWSKIEGLGARDGDTSEQRSLRLSVLQEISPRTGVSAGVQHTRFTTTVAGRHPYDATLAFIGMSHRF
ncbi:MAG: TIGR03016 family PEP-CTERM system-associated outer membrane protein [Pseudomonadota bacterium]